MDSLRPLTLLVFALLTVSVPRPLCAQTRHIVFPSATDPAITNFNHPHLAYFDPGASPRHQLFLFFPGTGGVPFGYTEILKTAARTGFNSIGLMYVNDQSINFDLCGLTNDVNCHRATRQEIIEGLDYSPLLEVTRTDSIEHRLQQLLLYLDANFPGEGWGQFLTPSTNLVWGAMVVSGHSQGAGHAGLLAKLHEVRRSIQFAGMDWFALGGRPADWISAPGLTPANRYFGFSHLQDDLVDEALLQQTWSAYGLDAFGPRLFVENTNGPPYAGSHEFMTDLLPRGESASNSNLPNYHSATVVDSAVPLDAGGEPVYIPVWQFMMAGPSRLPEVASMSRSGAAVRITWAAETNLSYQVEGALDLSNWTPAGEPVAGVDGDRSTSLTGTAAEVFRLRVAY